MAEAPEPPIFGAPLPQERVADGEYGLDVVRVLEAAQTSLRNDGERVAIESAP